MQEFTTPELFSSPFDVLRHLDGDGEYWMARELQGPLGYEKWERFEDAIERAILSAKAAGGSAQGFSRVRENLGTKPRADFRLTRHAAYLVAMNGDVRKPEIAEAQHYFAAKAREAEVAPPRKDPGELTTLEILDIARTAELGRLEERRLRELAEGQVAELTPAAEAWEKLATATGDYAVADAAKILTRGGIKIGQQRLFTKLREYGWCYRPGGDGRHRAYQTAMERGWLSELPSSHYHPRTGELVLDPPQVRVTVKGLAELHRRLGGGTALAERKAA